MRITATPKHFAYHAGSLKDAYAAVRGNAINGGSYIEDIDASVSDAGSVPAYHGVCKFSRVHLNATAPLTGAGRTGDQYKIYRVTI